MNRKAYFCQDLNRFGYGGSRYIFCELPEHAGFFESREGAEKTKDLWNANGVKVQAANGGTIDIQNFEIEEWNGRFLIACYGPFLYDESRPEHATIAGS